MSGRFVHGAGTRASALRASRALHLTCTVFGGRGHRTSLAARVPAHRPAAEDRARRAPARAAAGESRADPEPRARDQESAGRHPRRRAAARARARPRAADRVHAGDHRRSRPAAVAGQPVLLTPHRLPTYRRTNIHEVLVRVKGVVQAEFPAHSDPVRFRREPSGVRRRSRAADAGAAQHRSKRGAGAVRERRRGPQIRLRTRVARGVTLVKKRHRLALMVAVEDNGPGVAPRHPRPNLLSVGLRPRGRQRLRSHDRADARGSARRQHRMR